MPQPVVANAEARSACALPIKPDDHTPTAVASARLQHGAAVLAAADGQCGARIAMLSVRRTAGRTPCHSWWVTRPESSGTWGTRSASWSATVKPSNHCSPHDMICAPNLQNLPASQGHLCEPARNKFAGEVSAQPSCKSAMLGGLAAREALETRVHTRLAASLVAW